MPEIDIQQNIPQINIDTATRTYHLPIASETQLGGIKVGNNLTIEEDGTLNAEATEYDLPVATSSTLGGVKIGSGLNISDGVASVVVDNTLSSTSTHPVQNSVVSSNLSTLTTGLQTVSNNLTTLGNNFTTLSNTVSGHTTSITNLETTVGNHTTAIQANTDNISNNTSAIENNTNLISGIDDRLETAESDIIDLESNLSTLSETQDTLATVDDNEITYSYLLPVSTWTSGSLYFSTRGLIVNCYINLEGSLSLAAGNSTLIYTLPINFPTINAYGILNTDDGVVTVSINTSGEITLSNISGSNMSINKVQGCLSYTLSFPS